jgi:hypothetical protein
MKPNATLSALNCQAFFNPVFFAAPSIFLKHCCKKNRPEGGEIIVSIDADNQAHQLTDSVLTVKPFSFFFLAAQFLF